MTGRTDWYNSTKRRPFVSVYAGASFGTYVTSWNPEQRVWREAKIERGLGIRPIYRINLRFHKGGNAVRGRRALESAIASAERCRRLAGVTT